MNKVVFVFLLLMIQLIHASTYQTSISDSKDVTSIAYWEGQSCSYGFSLSSSYSFNTIVSATANSDLISPSTSLTFSVVPGSEVLDYVLSSSNIPEVIYTSSINNMVSHYQINNVESKFFSQAQLNSYKQDYNNCVMNILTDCQYVRGYDLRDDDVPSCYDHDKTKLDVSADQSILDYIFDYNTYTVSNNGVANPGNYVQEIPQLKNYPNKRIYAFLICYGEVSFDASNSHTITFDSLQSVSDTLPSYCFQSDANGYYSSTCDIQVNYHSECYPIFSDDYSGTVYSYTMYSPTEFDESAVLTVSDLCHGTMDASISADSVTMVTGSSKPYSFTVNNIGDIPIQINSPSNITLSNGFTFTPNANIEFPVIIEASDSALIDGMLSSPSPMPDSFELSVSLAPARNAVSCDGNDVINSSATVSVEEEYLCSIMLDIDYVSSLCINQQNDVFITLLNSGDSDVLIDRYIFYLPDGTVFYNESCTSDCLIPQGAEKELTLTGVSVPMTNENLATFEVDYHKADDDSCIGISKKDTLLRDCSISPSFDLYSDDVNFYNAYEGFPVHASFKVFNSMDASDASPDAHVNYTISSGENIIEATNVPVSSLEPGASTGDYTTDSVNCEDRVTLEIWIEELEGDTDLSNNHRIYTQDCLPPSQQAGVCTLYFNSQDVTGTTVLMKPGSSIDLDIYCYDVDTSGNKILTSCSGDGEVKERYGVPTISGSLNYNSALSIYDLFRIITSPDASDGDHESFEISIQKSEYGKITIYSCTVDAETGISECSYFI